MRAAPDCRPPPTARHVSPPRSSTSHPPQQQDAVHRELRPGPAPAQERRISCRQQPAPPPRDAAKMSPRIIIGPEPVLAAHAAHDFCAQKYAKASLRPGAQLLAVLLAPCMQHCRASPIKWTHSVRGDAEQQPCHFAPSSTHYSANAIFATANT